MDRGTVPLPLLRDYFSRLGACRTRQELLHTACVEIQRVIPYDQTAGIFDASDQSSIDGFGKSDIVTTAYNSYYRTRKPLSLPSIVDWRRYGTIEFAADFMFPNRMYKTLRHQAPGNRIYMCIQRSRSSPDFLDSDIDVLGIITDYINSRDAGFLRTEHPLDRGFSGEGIRDRFGSLSERESEICSLVARRFATSEIAASLFISGRTVEKHLESVFEKLDVRSREQLRWRLGVSPPPLALTAREET
jgi:hypothetical protein